MKKQPQIAIILSGCGVYDGSEIHEVVLTMLAIDKNNAQYTLFAPDIPQYHVVNHITGEEQRETRSVLVEASRIARGKIEPLSCFDPKKYDALILPGGFGAAKNLSNFAFKGEGFSIYKEVEQALKQMAQLNKPIGALCIAPVILAKIFEKIKITVGQDEDTAATVEKLGAMHIQTTYNEITVDEKHKVVTTPCYMLDASISQINKGINKLVEQVLKLI